MSLMLSKEFRITASDGTPLAATLYEPTAKTGLEAPLCLVVINGDAGVPRRFYAPFAEHLAERGAAVLTYDYRGIGGSLTGDVKDARVTVSQWGRLDATGALQWAQQYIAKLPVLVIAHGIGGQLAGLTDNPDQANEYLFIGASLDHWQYWPKSERMRRSWRHSGKVPMLVRTFGCLPRGTLGNKVEIPGPAALRWVRWARHELGAAGVEKAAGFSAMTAPITAYSFADDEWSSMIGAQALLDCFPNSRSVHIPLTPHKAGLEEIGHHGFFEPMGEDQLWPRATEWLRREIPLVMAQRAEEAAAKRAAAGLPPKPTKQAVERAAKLRAMAGVETARKAAEAAAQAELEAAKQAEEEANRQAGRRRGRRRSAAAGGAEAGGRMSAQERRAQRASRRQEREEVTAAQATPAALPDQSGNDREVARTAAGDIREGLKTGALSALSAALGGKKKQEVPEAPEVQATESSAQERAEAAANRAAMARRRTADTGGAPVDAAEARRQAAAIARMAKAGEAAGDKSIDESSRIGGDRVARDRFRRVPSRKDDRGVKDTDVE